MSNFKEEIDIKFNFDASKATNGLQNYSKAMGELTKRLDLLAKSMEDGYFKKSEKGISRISNGLDKLKVKFDSVIDRKSVTSPSSIIKMIDDVDTLIKKTERYAKLEEKRQDNELNRLIKIEKESDRKFNKEFDSLLKQEKEEARLSKARDKEAQKEKERAAKRVESRKRDMLAAIDADEKKKASAKRTSDNLLSIDKKLSLEREKITKNSIKNKESIELANAKLVNAKELADYREHLRSKRKADILSLGSIGNAVKTLSKFSFAKFIIQPLQAAFNFVSRTISDSIKETISFNSEMAKVRAITKASSKDIKTMSLDIAKLGTDFGITSDAAVKLYLSLSRMGVAGKDLSKVARAASALAAAVGGDVNESAQTLVTTMNAFGISFDNADEMANKMVKTLNSAALDMGEFKTILSYVASSSDAVGVSFEKTSAMIAVLRNNGLKASQVGTSLRNIFSKLVDEGKDVSDVITKLKKDGMTYSDAVELVGQRAANALTVLVDKWNEVADAQRRAAMDLSTAEGQALISGSYSRAETVRRQYTGMKSYIATAAAPDRKVVDIVRDAVIEYGVNSNEAKSAVNEMIQSWIISQAPKDLTSKMYGGNPKEAEAALLELESLAKDYFKKHLDFDWESDTGISLSPVIGNSTKLTETKRFKSSGIVYGAFSQIYKQRDESEASEALQKAEVIVADSIKRGGLRTPEERVEAFRDAYLSIAKEMGVNNAMQHFPVGLKDVSVGQRDENVRTEAYASWKKLINRQKELEFPKTRSEIEEKDEIADKLKKYDKWNFIDDDKTGTHSSAMKNIRKQFNQLSIKKGIDKNYATASDMTERYREQMSSARTPQEAESILREYSSNLSKFRQEVNPSVLSEQIENNNEIVKDLISQLEKDKKEFEKTHANKYKGRMGSYEATTNMENYLTDYDILMNDLLQYKTTDKRFIRPANQAMRGLLSSMPDVPISHKYIQDSKVGQEISNMILAYQEEMAGFNEDTGKGNVGILGYFKRLKEFKGNIEPLREKNRERRLKNSTGVFNERKKINEILNSIRSGEDSSFYEKMYKVSSPVQLEQKLLERISALDKEDLRITDEYNRSEKGIVSMEKGLFAMGTGKKDEIKAFAGEVGNEALNASVDMYQNIQDRMLQATLDRIEEEMKAEERKTERMQRANEGVMQLGLVSQTQYAQEKKRIEMESYEAQNQLMREKFEEEKKAEADAAKVRLAQRLAEIAMNVLLAESKKGLFGVATAPIVISAFSAMAIAQSAAELSAINKKKYVPQKYEKGGYVEGESHANGGVKFSVNGDIREMEGGEFIVNRESTAKYRSMLESINNDTIKSEAHYYKDSSSIIDRLNAIENGVNKPIRAYIVSSDIGKDNKFRAITNSKTSL